MKQTAVEFLEKEFDKFIEWDINGDPIFIVNDVNKIWDAFEQALELEKQQQIQFANDYTDAVMGEYNLTATEFYSETYKKQD
jgi:hypothetical protein